MNDNTYISTRYYIFFDILAHGESGISHRSMLKLQKRHSWEEQMENFDIRAITIFAVHELRGIPDS